MYGVIVTINIKPGFKERFMPSMLEDTQGSVNNEPGCLRFDGFQDSEDPNRIYLMEEYVDEVAFETHTRQPHFVKWQETTKDWFAGPIEIKRVSAIYPPER
jgi:(4S)-4-hydroxy-5-phosphonooxypentane-2,3-dione isomerase